MIYMMSVINKIYTYYIYVIFLVLATTKRLNFKTLSSLSEKSPIHVKSHYIPSNCELWALSGLFSLESIICLGCIEHFVK